MCIAIVSGVLLNRAESLFDFFFFFFFLATQFVLIP